MVLVIIIPKITLTVEVLKKIIIGLIDRKSVV